MKYILWLACCTMLLMGCDQFNGESKVVTTEQPSSFHETKKVVESASLPCTDKKSKVDVINCKLTQGREVNIPCDENLALNLERYRDELVWFNTLTPLELTSEQFSQLLSSPHLEGIGINCKLFDETCFSNVIPAPGLTCAGFYHGKVPFRFLETLLKRCPNLKDLSIDSETANGDQNNNQAVYGVLTIPKALLTMIIGDSSLLKDSLAILSSVNSKDMNLLVIKTGHRNSRIRPFDISQIGNYSSIKALHLENISLENKSVSEAVYHLDSLSLTKGNIRCNIPIDKSKAVIGYIGLKYCDIEPSLLPTLLQLPTLTMINLRGSNIKPDSLRTLEGLSDSMIEGLILGRTSITDNDMTCLKRLSKLTLIDVSHTALTDAAIDHFLQLPNLKYISCKNTGFSKEGILRLMQAGKTVLNRDKETGAYIALGLVTLTKEGNQGIPFHLSTELLDDLDDPMSLFPTLKENQRK